MALVEDGGVSAVLGGPYIYNDVPVNGIYPYVSLGEIEPAGDRDDEWQLTVHAWSQGRQGDAQVIAGALLGALDDAPLRIEKNRCFELRFSLADIRREKRRVYRTTVVFRLRSGEAILGGNNADE
jgi:hypothetical protein